MTADPITAERVEAYLLAEPGFLAGHPALYEALEPPLRVHGARLADHMLAMLQAARVRAAKAEAQAGDVLAASRAASCIGERVQAAVLAALGAHDLAECVAEAWPGLLGVDAAALCCEGARLAGRRVPAGTVRALLGRRQVTFRDRPEDAALLHAEAALLAERDVLVAVPGHPALLALVSRDPARLPGTQAYVFLGQVIAALLPGRDPARLRGVG